MKPENVIMRNKTPRFFDIVTLGESGAICKVLYKGLTFEAAQDILQSLEDNQEDNS